MVRIQAKYWPHLHLDVHESLHRTWHPGRPPIGSTRATPVCSGRCGQRIEGFIMKGKYKISCAVLALLTANTVAAVAQESGGGIEEVVVSAERRDMSVQKVPSTVQAFKIGRASCRERVEISVVAGC